ncbi:3,4-dihydroxy-2-butanone-4-phosphate synthase [Haloechinothrix salitolerans]|uniref:3,4-dihydroxy-2-butanone-4-phosphate synthase n=1 Tax=Haloechinothrix salitolerans TaxID=926830 RepID=A0ABW2C5X2_9PSEU
MAALTEGKPVLITDSADVGSAVLAAATASVGWVAWMIQYTSGFLCAPMPAARADLLGLPPMVCRNQTSHGNHYTVTVDARDGVTTGISAADRARTLRALAAPGTCPADLIRPGHVVPTCVRQDRLPAPLSAEEGAVRLCELAGLPPIAASAVLLADDGAILQPIAVKQLADRYDLVVLCLTDVASQVVAQQ